MAPKFLRRDEDDKHRKATACAGVLDLSHLARYTVGNKALEEELLRLFRAQMRLQVTAVSEADDIETWKFATHTLKGVARSIGAWRIGATAERLETLGMDGSDSERARLLLVLEQETAACEREIDRIVGDPQAEPESERKRQS